MSTTAAEWAAELRTAWRMIRVAPSQGTIRSYRLDHPGGHHVAEDLGDGLRHLLVPVSASDRPLVRPGSSVLDATIRVIDFDGLTTEWLDIRCTDSRLNDVFDALLCDLLAATPVSTPASATVVEVERWRDLLRLRSPGGLSVAAEMGLFGELHVCGVLAASGAPVGSGEWAGPIGGVHDISATRWWVEVKTVGTTSDRFTVHGLAQLDEEDDRPGWLCVVEAIEDQDGTSIGDLLALLTHDVGGFTALAEVAGWTPGSQRRWTVLRLGFARVSGVPRMTPEVLVGRLPGVERVDYEVLLAGFRTVAQAGSSEFVAAVTGP